MSTFLSFLLIVILGVVILFTLVFLTTQSPPTEERTGEGIPEKIQVFVDDIVQNIREVRVTDKLREFWEKADRTFTEWRRELGVRISGDRPESQSTDSSPMEGQSNPQPVQSSIEREKRCFKCGIPAAGGKFCHNCGAEARTCPICRKEIWQGEQVLECPMCGMMAHAPHILEWLRVKGTCPTCREKLVLN